MEKLKNIKQFINMKHEQKKGLENRICEISNA